MWLGSFVAEYSSGNIITSTVLCNLLADIPVQPSLWGYVVVLARTRQTDSLGPLFVTSQVNCVVENFVSEFIKLCIFLHNGKESELARSRIIMTTS